MSARGNFTKAIQTYLASHQSNVNMYSMATRLVYTLVVGTPDVKRSELTIDQVKVVEMVEDLASEFTNQGEHPLEAVQLAYDVISAQDTTKLHIWVKSMDVLEELEVVTISYNKRYSLNSITLEDFPDYQMATRLILEMFD
jgi:hypothetical protein